MPRTQFGQLMQNCKLVTIHKKIRRPEMTSLE